MTVVAALTQPIILSYVKGDTHSFFSKGMFLIAKVVFLPCFAKFYPIKQAKRWCNNSFFLPKPHPSKLAALGFRHYNSAQKLPCCAEIRTFVAV